MKLQLHDAVPRIPTHRGLVAERGGKGTPLISKRGVLANQKIP